MLVKHFEILSEEVKWLWFCSFMAKETCSFSPALHDFPSANTILSNDNTSVFLIKAPFSPFLPLFPSPKEAVSSLPFGS